MTAFSRGFLEMGRGHAPMERMRRRWMRKDRCYGERDDDVVKGNVDSFDIMEILWKMINTKIKRYNEMREIYVVQVTYSETNLANRDPVLPSHGKRNGY